MSEKLAPFAGLTLAALTAAIAWGATALAGDRCKAVDAMGASIAIHDQRKNVIGAIEDGNVYYRAALWRGRSRQALGLCGEPRRQTARLALSRIHPLLLIGAS